MYNSPARAAPSAAATPRSAQAIRREGRRRRPQFNIYIYIYTYIYIYIYISRQTTAKDDTSAILSSELVTEEKHNFRFLGGAREARFRKYGFLLFCVVGIVILCSRKAITCSTPHPPNKITS